MISPSTAGAPLAVLALLLTLQLGPALQSQPSSANGLAAGCSAWPGDTVHHYRGPSRASPTAQPNEDDSGLNRDELQTDLSAFGGRFPELTGVWAERQVTSTLSNAPLVGEIRSTTTTLFRVELTQHGNEYVAEVDVCAVDVQSEGMMRTIVPEAFVAGIPRTQRRGQILEDERGFRLEQEEHIQVLGAELADELNDPLPREDDDDRVVDQDSDGHPGVTLRVEGTIGGDIYMVQRVGRRLSGVIQDPNTIAGLVDWGMEQVTIGASSFMLNIQTNARADPDPTRNYFVTRRLDDGVDCAAIRQQQVQLFQR